MRDSLGAFLRAPAPVRINRPEWNVREYHDRRAVLQVLDVVLHPRELLGTERTESPSLEIHHVYQPDEMHALLVEAVPSRALAPFSVALEKLLSVIVEDVVLAGN